MADIDPRLVYKCSHCGEPIIYPKRALEGLPPGRKIVETPEKLMCRDCFKIKKAEYQSGDCNC